MLWDPFGQLAEQAAKVVADGWTAMMLSLWQAGLWVLRVVLKFEAHFLTPDISETGPAQLVYQTTFWIAGVLVVIMIMVQLCIVLVRRDGKSLARVLLGTGQFVLVWVCWLTYGAVVLAACGGLNDALMKTLLSVDAWDAWQPLGPLSGKDVNDAVLATVLGVMGLFLWVAAIAHFLVLMARAGGLLVLAATTPISAAGLVSDVGRAWFWKSVRWFHAAALAPVLMTLTMGLGVQISNGVALGLSKGPESAIGSAVPSVFMILISAVAPVALFKLLAFVDPGTNSGAAVRAGLAASGGIANLLGGLGARASQTGEAASQSDATGRSQGEAQSEAATAQRFGGLLGNRPGTPAPGTSAAAGPTATTSAASSTGATGGALGVAGAAAGVLGVIGQAAAAGIRAATTVGGAGSALFSDSTNQLGVGHNTYQPDFSRSGGGSTAGSAPQGYGEADQDVVNGNDGTLPTPVPTDPPLPTTGRPTQAPATPGESTPPRPAPGPPSVPTGQRPAATPPTGANPAPQSREGNPS